MQGRNRSKTCAFDGPIVARERVFQLCRLDCGLIDGLQSCLISQIGEDGLALSAFRRDDPADHLAPREGSNGEPAMAWVYLFIAGLLEIGWAIGLKYTEGFSRLWPSIGTVAAMVLSIAFLGLALKSLPVGTAYAIWTGIGAVGTVLLGIVLFAEPATALRLGCVALIVTGMIGLKLAT
jgi:quaternary ammonium compound-resistance protein SugE